MRLSTLSSLFFLLFPFTVFSHVDPPACPGTACSQIPGVTSYVDSTSSTTHEILCFKPPTCNGDCPLYVWVDGTSHNAILEIPDKYFVREMVARGYVSCVALYDDDALGYTGGCPSFRTKARDIFDPTRPGSLTNQICGVHADCNLGLATHGWSQGAHISALASEYVSVSGSLLFGNGNRNTYLFITTSVSCMNDVELGSTLPSTRRRSIVGEFDDYFDSPPVLDQQKATSGYDCGARFNCLGRIPDTCLYANGEQQCASSGQYYHPNCPQCPNEATSTCETNGGLFNSACPFEVPDSFTGGTIEDSAGYYIVPGQDHGFFLLVDDGANSVFEPAFLDDNQIWGLKQSLDWLDRTARHVTAGPTNPPAPTASPTSGPTPGPTVAPIIGPTPSPSDSPSVMPSAAPVCSATETCGATEVCCLDTSTCQQTTTQICEGKGKNQVCTSETSFACVATNGGGGGGSCESVNCSNIFFDKNSCNANTCCKWNQRDSVCVSGSGRRFLRSGKE